MYVTGIPFSIKGVRNGCLLGQNGIQKGRGLDLGAEHPRTEFCGNFPLSVAGRVSFVSFSLRFSFVSVS